MIRIPDDLLQRPGCAVPLAATTLVNRGHRLSNDGNRNADNRLARCVQASEQNFICHHRVRTDERTPPVRGEAGIRGDANASASRWGTSVRNRHKIGWQNPQSACQSRKNASFLTFCRRPNRFTAEGVTAAG